MGVSGGGPRKYLCCIRKRSPISSFPSCFHSHPITRVPQSRSLNEEIVFAPKVSGVDLYCKETLILFLGKL